MGGRSGLLRVATMEVVVGLTVHVTSPIGMPGWTPVLAETGAASRDGEARHRERGY